VQGVAPAKLTDFKDRKSGNQKLNEKERWLWHSGRIRTPASLAENSDFTVQVRQALMPMQDTLTVSLCSLPLQFAPQGT
jgi:hypothetical protein